MLGEETLGALHWLCAIACFYVGTDWAGWLFAARALGDEYMAIKAAWKGNTLEPDE
jgi:hypothetical protein